MNSDSHTVKVQLSSTTYKADCTKGNCCYVSTCVACIHWIMWLKAFWLVAVDAHKRKFEFDIPVSEETNTLVEVMFIKCTGTEATWSNPFILFAEGAWTWIKPSTYYSIDTSDIICLVKCYFKLYIIKLRALFVQTDETFCIIIRVVIEYTICGYLYRLNCAPN